jgi:hypothetical protein
VKARLWVVGGSIVAAAALVATVFTAAEFHHVNANRDDLPDLGAVHAF